MRVALVLGSGGARGYAHIGVIEVLRDAGHEIVAISGSSMGAVVGGVTAAGQLDAFTDWVTHLTRRDVLRMLDVHLGAPGLVGADKIVSKLHELTGEIDIENLQIPFTAVATDVEARREAWFRSGPLHPAVRASMAIPGVFTPVTIDGRLYVDGGLLNPVPIEPMAFVDADLTVAVSLSGNRRPTRPATVEPAATNGRRSETFKRLRAALGNEADTNGNGTDGKAAEFGTLGLLELVSYSLDTTAALVGRYRSAARPPDIAITVPFNVCGTFDFHRAPEVIAAGRQAAHDALAAFEAEQP